MTASIEATDEELKNGVVAVDKKDGNVSGSVMIDHIKKKEDGSGDFDITYVGFDHSSNLGKLTRTLHYTDYESPKFELSDALRFPAGKQINLLSYFSATDCIDGNITPFISIGGDTAVLDKKPQQGFYDCTVSVTNSVGDTVTLPIQVEVYDGNAARPQINLSSYLVYLQAGSEFDPNSYLTQIKEYDKVKQVVFSENVADPDNQISITQIYVESGVDIYTPGVYTVSYLYTSPASGLDCTAKLIVVVMIQEGYKSQSLDSQIDLRYIFRTLKKNAVFILMCVCLTGMFSYVILDHSLKDTYTVSVNLCVIPRDNTSEKLAETNIENALERSVNVLNSDTMRDQIMKASGSSRVKGNLSASVVADTNIIRMSASGTNAESAYKLLKGALQQYPELSDYFESGYVLQPLSSISANNVQKTEKATLRYSLLLILLVLAGGIGATVCLCIFTDKIHSMEQAKRLLDIPMIGSLDYVKKKSGQKALLISDQDTDHVYEEAVDRIVTSIRSEMSAEGYKTLMVGSIKENDGKSTVTANIALNLARRGKKVVLVDCDMRHPSLAKIFDATVDPKEQFSEYLLGKCELDQVLKQTEVQAHPMDCIWQKKAVAKPYRLLGSERFISLINQLKEQFDYVVMDTPPLELIRDAEIISETADAMLMVMRQDEVHAVAVNDTVDLLEENGVTVIGGVLNMTKGERDTSKDRDGYRKYYNENAKIENAGE